MADSPPTVRSAPAVAKSTSSSSASTKENLKASTKIPLGGQKNGKSREVLVTREKEVRKTVTVTGSASVVKKVVRGGGAVKESGEMGRAVMKPRTGAVHPSAF